MTNFEPLRISAAPTKALSQDYASEGIVQVPHFLTEDSAATLENLLLSHREWYISTVNSQRQPVSALERLVDDEQIASLRAEAYEHADASFRYFYRAFPIMERYLHHNLSRELKLVGDFLSDSSFLEFISFVVGVEPKGNTDGHLACYRAGDFLGEHTDATAPEDGRRRAAAFVLNLSRNWPRDWGGTTMFWNEDSSARAFAPSWNSLLLFSVPRPHSVSQVMCGSISSRVSIAGWVHTE